MSDIARVVAVGGETIGNRAPLTVIAGPCQLESAPHAVMIAQRLAQACADAGAGFVFKGSFDKANRTSVTAPRGVGMVQGLEILAEVRASVGCPVLTDVHTPAQCEPVARVVDILQIPALLCRQTDLLLAAGETGAVVNIKKGQFLAPWDMEHVVAKVESTGNTGILLCERGTSFGYNTLVSDMRAIAHLADTGYPVVFDASHSVQQPGGQGGTSGGERRFIPLLARAAVAVGVAAVFIETHETPDRAPSDGANSMVLDDMPALVASLMAFDRLSKGDPLRDCSAGG